MKTNGLRPNHSVCESPEPRDDYRYCCFLVVLGLLLTTGLQTARAGQTHSAGTPSSNAWFDSGSGQNSNSLAFEGSPSSLGPAAPRETAYSSELELQPRVRLVHPVGLRADRGLRLGFLLGTGAGTALTSFLASSHKSGPAQLLAGLGVCLSSSLVGFLIGHGSDPTLAQTFYPPDLRLELSCPDESLGTPCGAGRERRLQVDILNAGLGRAVDARLALSVLGSSLPVRSSYRGGASIGTIEAGGRRRVAISIRTDDQPMNRLVIGVACSYRTQWGAEDQASHDIVLSLGQVRDQ